MGCKTRSYISGSEYLERFNPEAAGVLLMDVRMTPMSGFAVMQRLGTKPLRPSIIILTGYADFPTAILAFRHGEMDYFPKNVSHSELQEALQKVIARIYGECMLRRRKLARLSLLSDGERAGLRIRPCRYAEHTYCHMARNKVSHGGRSPGVSSPLLI